MENMKYVIEASGVCKNFYLPVLRGINLHIKKGEVYALLGENGAGKSTLLKTIMGLLRRDNGDLRVLGLDPAENEKRVHEKVGYLPENFKCYDWMTVNQLINFVRPAYNAWDDEFASDLIQRLRLPLDRPIKTFSRGTNRKTGLLLVLAMRPKLLLLDEPTSGLDPLTRREFLEEMIRALSEQNVTIVLSTHRADDVERFADRIGILQDGVIAIDETVENILESANRVMIRFEGEIPDNLRLSNAILITRFENRIKALIYPYNQNILEQDLAGNGFKPDDVEIQTTPVSVDDFFVDFTKAYLQKKKVL